MQPQVKKKRIHIIDALRGFSLAGIVLVHMVENYIGGPATEAFNEATRIGVLDYIVEGFNQIVLRGKFFALFSFLFGLSFFIQMDSAHSKGRNYGIRFLWRIILLLLIGLVHHFFYRGDILTVYALAGIFLIPFYKISTKTILVLTGILFIGIGRFLILAITGDGNIFGSDMFMPDSPATDAYYELLKTASFTEVGWDNSTAGQLMKMEFQFGIFSRGYLTFGFFLLGLLVGRFGILHRYKDYVRYLPNLFWTGGILFVVGAGIAIAGFSQMGTEFSFANGWVMLGLTGMDIINIGLTAVILGLFVWLYNKANWEKRLVKFAPYGRMALTNYVTQTVIGTFIFYGWGMGYLGTIPHRYTFLMGLAIIVIQMILSAWWLGKFQYGPLEWLWRSATHFTWFPLKKKE